MCGLSTAPAARGAVVRSPSRAVGRPAACTPEPAEPESGKRQRQARPRLARAPRCLGRHRLAGVEQGHQGRGGRADGKHSVQPAGGCARGGRLCIPADVAGQPGRGQRRRLTPFSLRRRAAGLGWVLWSSFAAPGVATGARRSRLKQQLRAVDGQRPCQHQRSKRRSGDPPGALCHCQRVGKLRP